LKVLLDTTYLLPLIGIAIKEVSKDALSKLNAKGYELSISEITLFELSAKGAKYTHKNGLSPERVTLGVKALLYDDSIEKIPTYDSKILLTAITLRSLMVDFVDCLILSTALNSCDELITEDQVIHDLQENKKYLDLQSTINPDFKMYTITQTS
jgi:predicted nucleic acid-binding protein